MRAPRQAHLLQATLLATLEKAANQALASDPASLQALTNHSGRLLAFHLRFPATSVYLLVVEDGIELFHASDAAADVSVSAAANELAALFFNWNLQPSLIGGSLQIEGDRELLQSVRDILKQLDIDWGALLSPWVGDDIAQQLDFGGRQLMSWMREAGSQLGKQLGQYFTQDSGLLALRQDVYEFCQDVDELRFDADRLSARINRLQRRQPPES